MRAAELGIPADDAMRLQLIAEELFTNTIAHGHHGDSDHAVRLRLNRAESTSTLHYEDDAPPFDIFNFEQKFRLTVEVGGQGINLIRGMSKAQRYQRQGALNITEVDL